MLFSIYSLLCEYSEVTLHNLSISSVFQKEESIAKSAPDPQQNNKENKNPTTATSKEHTIPNGHVPIEQTNGHVPKESSSIATQKDTNKDKPPDNNNINKQNSNSKSKNKAKKNNAPNKNTAGNTNKTESNKKKDHNATSEKRSK